MQAESFVNGPWSSEPVFLQTSNCSFYSEFELVSTQLLKRYKQPKLIFSWWPKNSSPSPEPRTLFNGRDLSGWTIEGRILIKGKAVTRSIKNLWERDEKMQIRVDSSSQSVQSSFSDAYTKLYGNNGGWHRKIRAVNLKPVAQTFPVEKSRFN